MALPLKRCGQSLALSNGAYVLLGEGCCGGPGPCPVCDDTYCGPCFGFDNGFTTCPPVIKRGLTTSATAAPTPANPLPVAKIYGSVTSSMTATGGTIPTVTRVFADGVAANELELDSYQVQQTGCPVITSAVRRYPPIASTQNNQIYLQDVNPNNQLPGTTYTRLQCQGSRGRIVFDLQISRRFTTGIGITSYAASAYIYPASWAGKIRIGRVVNQGSGLGYTSSTFDIDLTVEIQPWIDSCGTATACAESIFGNSNNTVPPPEGWTFEPNYCLSTDCLLGRSAPCTNCGDQLRRTPL